MLVVPCDRITRPSCSTHIQSTKVPVPFSVSEWETRKRGGGTIGNDSNHRTSECHGQAYRPRQKTSGGHLIVGSHDCGDTFNWQFWGPAFADRSLGRRSCPETRKKTKLRTKPRTTGPDDETRQQDQATASSTRAAHTANQNHASGHTQQPRAPGDIYPSFEHLSGCFPGCLP